jgi:tetratricopeptide (TPR) repeat protein
MVLLLMQGVSGLFGQEGEERSGERDYNRYYRYPAGLAAEYQSLSPFTDYGGAYQLYELAGQLRLPLASAPVIQPTLQGGMITFDSRDQENPEKWDHYHLYGMGGITYANRFAREFEMGAELLGGVSQSFFPHLAPEAGTVGDLNLLLQGGGRISLSPSYTMSIEIHPNVKYLHSLGKLETFNGPIFGIGFAFQFRFGKDPDSAAGLIRSLRFGDVQMSDLFAAMQSYYPDNPPGRIEITNTESHPVRDVRVSFFQKGYMDSPTPAAAFDTLQPGASRSVELPVSFNAEVFKTEGITPLTGEVVVEYSSRGRPAEQRQPVSYDLYDKTALTWNDDRKVAAFITPADSALRNYASFIRQAGWETRAESYNQRLQTAMQIYAGLEVLGMAYQVDPSSPFTEVQENTMLVDSVSLPRETLSRITGDCDDLTVLYNSLLESLGIETGFITVPGHIYSVINTGVPAREYERIHPDRSMSIALDGELWIPVEITMIGSEGFLRAWQVGLEQWRSYEEQTEERGFHRTAEAQQTYRPVGLRETDLGLQYGSREAIRRGFERHFAAVAEETVSGLRGRAETERRPDLYNGLGILYARFGMYRRAADAFTAALAIRQGYFSARVNMAGVQYLRDAFREAQQEYRHALDLLREKGLTGSLTAMKILVNLSKTSYQLEEYGQARSYLQRAAEIDGSVTERYAYLAGGDEAGGRAAEAGGGMPILFIAAE